MYLTIPESTVRVSWCQYIDCGSNFTGILRFFEKVGNMKTISTQVYGIPIVMQLVTVMDCFSQHIFSER